MLLSPIVPSDSDTVILQDGRRLGYAVYGAGPPIRGDGRGLCEDDRDTDRVATVFYFHGLPSSRYEGAALHNAALTSKTRIISLDRPGIGLSTPYPHQGKSPLSSKSAKEKDEGLVQWSNDVLEVADLLGISTFHIAAVSGGAPYALACARFHTSERLKGVSIVAGLGPWEMVKSHFNLTQKFLAWCSCYIPSAATAILEAGLGRPARDPDPVVFEEVIEASLAGLDEDSRSVLLHSSVDEGEGAEGVVLRCELTRSMREAFRQGSDGIVHDSKLSVSKWPFRLEDIPQDVPVSLWYGQMDANMPVEIGRALASAIPGSNLVELAGETHFTILPRHGVRILRELVHAW